jgi:DNA-binding MarR family transcriptional regulator
MNHSSDESLVGTLPRGIAGRPALLLHKLGNQILARAEGPLAAIGLSGRQYVVLAVMESDEPASQLELAKLTGLLPAQVVPVLDELEARGLVERRRSETDRRRSVVRLTAEGRALLARADELDRALVDLMFHHLDAPARAELAETLRLALARVQQPDRSE